MAALASDLMRAGLRWSWFAHERRPRFCGKSRLWLRMVFFYQRLLDFSIHPSSSAVFAFGAILVLVVQNRKFYSRRTHWARMELTSRQIVAII